MEFLIGMAHYHPCDIHVLQCKADFRIRLHAKEVFVSDCEMVPQKLPISVIGVIEVNFHVQAIVEFHVPVFIYSP